MAAVYAASRPHRAWILAGACSAAVGVAAPMALAAWRLAIPGFVAPPVAWSMLVAGGMLAVAGAGVLAWQWRENNRHWYDRMRLLEARGMPASPAKELLAPESLRAVTAQIHEIVELAATCTGILEQQRAIMHAIETSRQAIPRSILFDPVTGAITHTALMTRLTQEIAFAHEHSQILAVAVFDVNDFHSINARYGYRFGDETLFAIAGRLRGALGEHDLLARLERDRFVVVSQNCDFLAMQRLIERAQHAVDDVPLEVLQENHPLPGYAERIAVTVRTGLACFPDDGMAAEELLEHALAAVRPNALRHTSPPAPPYLEPRSVSNASEHMDAPPNGMPRSFVDVMTERYSSIQALSAALEAHDTNAATQSHFLAELAEETALGMGRVVEEARLVALAALLHDVGNLGIPAEILHKVEPLSPEEWAFVREHPHLGERLLTSVGGVLAAIAPIVAAHRERWDGTGYPLGLRGEAIPLGARIVAVCDAYGAMIAPRPYRPAFTPQDALAEIQRGAGTQFDPQVVKSFTMATLRH
jgi:two-component system, cell cycle response regulator